MLTRRREDRTVRQAKTEAEPKAKTVNQNRKVILMLAALGVLFLVGLFTVLYPVISNWWNSRRDRQLMDQYDEAVSGQAADEKPDYTAEFEAAEKYNEGIGEEALPDAFAIRDETHDAYYESLLNVGGDGMMGYVVIPSIEVQVPIYHYTYTDVLQKGAGHLFGSSLPVGGAGTHSVITAHRGLPSAKLFTDLNLLEEGDVFYLHILDRVLAYQVDQIKTVLPEQTNDLAIVQGQDYVTLLTCTPYGVNTHRLLVRGHRIEYDGSAGDSAGESGSGGAGVQVHSNMHYVILQIVSAILGVALAVVILVTIRIVRKQKGKKRHREEGKAKFLEEEGTEISETGGSDANDPSLKDETEKETYDFDEPNHIDKLENSDDPDDTNEPDDMNDFDDNDEPDDVNDQ